ncbi:MAG TPA: zinc ribbon domain-containing protein [Spirochaetia bacterium]|nr:zinc ribbon domain-containing protein [Spirochaetia bacterium]
MPNYDYECDSCGHRFEAFQSMSDEPIKVCPKCGRRRVRRLIGGGLGVIFKGSGFYVTDHRGSSGSAGDKHKARDTGAPAKQGAEGGGGSSESSATSGSSSDGGGEKKPAASKNGSENGVKAQT